MSLLSLILLQFDGKVYKINVNNRQNDEISDPVIRPGVFYSNEAIAQ